MNKNEIIDQLGKNRAKNISMIGVIENYGIESSLKYQDSLLITAATDHLWAYISSNSEKELIELLKKFNYKTSYFASLEDWMIPIISNDRQIEWELKTERLILANNIKINSNFNNKFEKNGKQIKIKELKSNDADFIFENSHYQDFTSKAYIKERIELDSSAGIFIQGELAGWGLTHDDGAIGFIHVRDDFRKQGYAGLIMQKLIRDKRRNSKDVFLNVELDNLKAKKLFYSLGFEFDRIISWVKLS
jgi:GNAT superfamily N-acetyltransferase